MVRQQESFVTLMENYDNYKDYLETSENSSGTAEKKYESYQDSYAAAQNRLTAALEGIANDSSIINLLTELLDIGTGLVTALKYIVKYIPTMLAQVEGISSLFGKGAVATVANGLSHLWKGGGQGWYKFAGIKSSLANGQKNFDATVGAMKNSDNGFVKGTGKLLTTLESPINKLVNSFTKAKTVTDKNITATENETQKKEENTTATSANTGEVQQNTTATATDNSQIQTHTVELADGTMVEVEDTMATTTHTQSVQQDTNANRQNASSGGSSGSGSGSSFFASKQGGLMIASWVAAGIASSISQWATAATSHSSTRTKANGETETTDVDSSETAQKAGAGVSAIGNLFSGLPIIGGLIGTGFTYLGELISKQIDSERDFANNLTETANENLSALQNINSDIESIGADLGSLTSQDAVEQFMSTLYSSDEESQTARILLEQYIKPYLEKLYPEDSSATLYDLLNDIKEGDEDAYNALKLAQINAEKDQVVNKYASQMYENQESLSDAYTDYVNADTDTTNDVAQGGGAGALATGVTSGVAAGAMIGAGIGLANVWNPIGWVSLIVAGVALAITGTVAAIQVANAEEAAREEKALKESQWNASSNTEKLITVQQTMQEAIENNNSELVDKCEVLISSLEEQISLTNEMLDEIDELTLQAALISASVEYTGVNGETTTKSLADMSVAELYNIGKDAILMAYAQGVEANGGLLNQNVWADAEHTTLSESGYSYLTNKLKSQEDEEINAFLSGQSYTLNDVLKMQQKQGNTKEVRDLLQSFATALNVPVGQLEALKDTFGALTLAEDMMSTSELSESIGNYTDLVGDIAEGAGDTSSWMATIIDQFPDLIAYMGDTSALFSQIGTKLKQLSSAYLESQYEDIASNDSFYKTIKEDFYKELSAEDQDALDALNITNVSDVMKWIQTQYDDEGVLGKAATNVLTALETVVNEYGVEVTSSILKDYYDQLIEFKTDALDKEIDNLNEQKEALQEINSQREYENKLIQAKLNLENAAKEKKRVYRAGVGWVYESDQSTILEAQENLESVENEKTISSLETQIAELQQEKDNLSSIYDNQNAETLQNLYDSFVENAAKEGTDASTANGFLKAIKSGVGGISESLASMIQKDAETSKDEKTKALNEAKEAWETLQNTSKGSADYNTAVSNYHTAMSTAISQGVTESDTEDWGTGPVTDSSGNALSAWSVAEGDESKQLSDIKQTVVLPNPDDTSKEFIGQVSLGSPQYDSDLLNYIYKDLKNRKGFIWVPTGDGGVQAIYSENNGWDARYTPKDTDGDFITYANRLKTDQGVTEAIFTGFDGTNESVYYKNGMLYKIIGAYDGETQNTSGLYQIKASEKTHWLQQADEAAAEGSLDLAGTGNTLINELGTEAIVTPEGTLTTLPSHTGIIPADITKNLWELGEVAPAISRTMMTNMIPDSLQQNTMSTNTDESLNVNTLNITMNPDGSFDVDSFVTALRSRVALTRNSSK